MRMGVLIACLLLQASCASRQDKTAAEGGTAATARAGGEPGMGRHAMACPARVPGTRVEIEEIEGGAAVVFRAPSDQVEEVRRRVAQMAAMHERQPVGGGMMCCRGGGLPDAQVSAEETDDGARLLFRAPSEAEVAALRDQLRAHVDRMQAGECPMLEETGEGATETPVE